MIVFSGGLCYDFFTAGDSKMVLCRSQDELFCLQLSDG